MTPTTNGQPAPLFRSAALDRMASPDQLNMAASIVRPGAWLLLGVIAIVIGSGVFASLVIHVPVKVDADGILLSPEGVHDVTAVTGGQVRSLAVKVGDTVKAGEVIAKLSQPDARQELEQAQADLRDAQDEFAKTQAFQVSTQAGQEVIRSDERKNLQDSIAFAQTRIGWLNDRIKGQQDLATQGYVSRQQVQASKVELGQALEEFGRNQNQLHQLDIDQGTQRTDRARETMNLQLKIAAAQRRVEMLGDRMTRTVDVTSPYDGVVAEMKINEGEVAERGTALMTLIPADAATVDGAGVRHGPPVPLVATLYVSPTDGKRVRPGMEVEILPATAKREEFGFIVGRVQTVSEVPATQEGMQRAIKNRQLVSSLSASGAPFEVQAQLVIDPATPSGFKWSSSRGPNATLSGGSPCKAEIVTRSQTILELLLPPVRRLIAEFT